MAASCLGLLLIAPVGLHFYLRSQVNRYRAELVRKGEQLDINRLLPTPPLPDENGGPALRMLLTQIPRSAGKGKPIFAANPPEAMHLLRPGYAVVGWRQPDLRNGKEDNTNQWEDLRVELDGLAATFAQIRSELQHPAFDFNINYRQGFSIPLPHLGSFNALSQALLSSILLKLHDGKLPEAITDLRSELDLIRVLEKEPLLISQIIRVRQMEFASRATWEALQASGWSDDQLAQLQQRWQSLQFIGPFSAAIILERAMMVSEVAQWRESDSQFQKMQGTWGPGGSTSTSSDPWEAMARGGRELILGLETAIWRNFWSYYDERRFLTIVQAGIDGTRPPARSRSLMAEQDRMRSTLTRLGLSPESGREDPFMFAGHSITMHQFLSNAGINCVQCLTRAFRAETEREIVVAAIALKRHQLKFGRLPDTVGDLTPELLAEMPTDFMDGQPLRYIPNRDGSFLLYSVGLDGKDDGGSQGGAERPLSPKATWLSGRDWIWPQPATSDAIEGYNREIGEGIQKRFLSGQRKSKRK